MNNLVFCKTIENVRKHRDIKLLKTEKRRNYLVSEPNYHTTKFFYENVLAIKIKNNTKQILINKPVYLGLSLLELSKIAMYDFWYDQVKPKCKEKAKPCYMDTGSVIVYIKTETNYADIAREVEATFDTSNYELDGPLPKEKNKKVIDLMNGELGGKIMKELAALRAKTFSYLTGNNNGDKKVKGTKKCATKRKLKFTYYKNCLKAAQLENNAKND